MLGGMRSGKSARAESLLRAQAGVTYVACGPARDDADWAERVAAHRERRPTTWTTCESTDLPAVLADLPGPALVDCVGTWLTSHLDALAVWEAPRRDWEPAVERLVDELTTAVAGFPHELVVVSNEVGLTLVPPHRSGRIFADWLGLANQRLAAACDAVDLVVAGQVLAVKAP